MRAEILTIGDELCRGEIVDTNSSYLAGRLWDAGITTRWMTSCNDDEADLAAALSLAVTRADVVVCSGGLGPTEDDLTVDVAARLAGVDVVVDEASRHRMEARFAGRIEVTPIQLRQVRIPAGARVHGNPLGLAPCFELLLQGVPVICLPGFPREIHGIFDDALAPRFTELAETAGVVERIARRIYRVFGRGESQISEVCRGAVDPVPGASIHYQVKFPEILVKVVARAGDPETAQRRLDELDARLRPRLVPYLYGTGDENLVDRTVRRLIEQQATVATAESCTGGMIGELLTRRPGSSRAFAGGAIVYSNAEKVRQLGVRQATLDAHGAVSEQTVRELADGALDRFGTTMAVAVSGIAGPDGGTPDKPVGTVWLALARRVDDDVEGARVCTTRRLLWPGARDQIRTLAAWWALAMIDGSLATSSDDEASRARWVLSPEQGRRP